MEWATLAPVLASITVQLVTQAADTHSRAAQPVDTTVAAAALAAAVVDSTAAAAVVVASTVAVVVDTGNR